MILVTGATGLIGSHIIYKLIRQGHKVKAMKRATSNMDVVKKTFQYLSNNNDDLFKQINWVEGDLLDFSSLEDSLQDVSTIIHCAAFISFNKKDKKKLMATNFIGTKNLVDLAVENKIDKLLFISSVATLDRKNNTLIDEDSHWRKKKEKNYYAESKYLAEQEVWRAGQEGVKIIILNPSIVLGPGDWNKFSSNIFKLCYNGIPFYSEGKTGYIDVRDIANITLKMINDQDYNERYIISSQNLTYKEILYTISKNFNKKYPKINVNKIPLSLIKVVVNIILMFNKNFAVTNESLNHILNNIEYSNKKITRKLNYNFIKIDESIKYCCSKYLQEIN